MKTILYIISYILMACVLVCIYLSELTIAKIIFGCMLASAIVTVALEFKGQNK